jgi:putative membrane protein
MIMKKKLRLFFPVAAIAGSLFLFQACNNNGQADSNPKDSAEEHNEAKFDKLGEKDAQALVDAYTAGLMEVNMADTAKVYAKTTEAKTLAGKMAEGHTALNSQIRNLAEKKQVTLPPDISADEKAKISKMADHDKKSFDKDYAEDMVSKHKDAISLYEKCANECTDQDIRNWFASAVPELRKHLDLAMNSEEKLKAIKK